MKNASILASLLVLFACEDVPLDSGDTDTDDGLSEVVTPISLANDCGDDTIALISEAGTYSATTDGLADEFGPGAGGCGPLDLPGQDGSVRVAVPANATLEVSATFDETRNASLFVAEACEDDGCVAHGADGEVSWQNGATAAEVLVIIDSTVAGGGALTLTVAFTSR